MSEKMTVPLLDLKAQYATIKAEIAAALEEVLETQWFIMGPKIVELEKAIAEYCQTKFAVGCASGSDAILLALMANDVGPDSEIICPSYTFFATAGSISILGARPVWVDIDPVTYNMDPELTRKVAQQCTNLKAIMPVHLYGQAADLDAFLKIGQEFNVPIIEDAAQAIGTRDRSGTPAGSRGQIGCFSFFPTKNLGGYGDGGIVTTNDEALAESMSILRVHGSKPKYHHHVRGINARLDALQAAILLVKLKHLDSWHDQRRGNAQSYNRLFHDAGATSSATPLSGGGFPLRTPHQLEPPAKHIFNQYVIRVPGEIRDSLREHLREAGVGTEIYYPIPLHLQKCYADAGGREGDLPESELAAKETLALPIYPELTSQQIEYVAGTTISYISQHAAVCTS